MSIIYQLLRPSAKSRALSSRLGSLVLLFQRSPLVQMLFPEARMLGGAGLGEITQWTIATVAGLGAYDSVAGATTLTQLSPAAGSSTVPATKDSNLAFAFQVTGTETAPLSWQIVGTLPAGLNHTNSVGSTIDSITGIPTQTGNFLITIKAWEFKNNQGPVVSANFTINVGSAIIATEPASVLIASGDSTPLTVVGNGNGLTYQWFKGASPNTSSPISGETTASFVTPALTATTKYWVSVTRSGIVANSNTATVSIGFVPAITKPPAPVTINPGNTATLTVTASGTAPAFQWYLGDSGVTTNPVSGATTNSFTTPALTTTSGYWVRASNSLGSASSPAALVTVRIPPSISTQPVSTSINTGNTTTFTVAANGTAPTYQWYEGTSPSTTNPVARATDATFTTPVLSATTSYWVRIVNPAGTADSDTATVTVNSPPAITREPLSSPINSGGSVTLVVAASGTAPTFQWYLGNTGDSSQPIPDATSPSFTTPALTVTTHYWVRATNGLGITDSQTATVTLQFSPVFTTPPVSQTINSGATATFTFVATGDTPTFQWFLGNSGDISQPVLNATAATFTTPALSATTAYWVRATNPAGTSDSATVTVSVITPPLIVTPPASLIINPANSATLTIQATGTAPVYQWYRGTSGVTTTPVGGATTASFTTPALTATTSFWVRATNAAGSADSATAIITVRIPPAITRQPKSVTIVSGKTAKLKVVASGTTPTFQWFKGAAGNTKSPVKGARSATLTPSALKVTTTFWVRVSNPAGSVNSKAVVVTVKAAAAPTAASSSQSLVSTPGTFAIWQNSHFTPEQRADELISGPAADPDGDGISNAQEYLVGLSPFVSDPPPLLVSDLTSGVRFTAKLASGPGYSGLTRHCALEAADTSGHWATVSGYADIVGKDQLVTYTAPAPHPFYQLRVWLTP